MAGVKVINKCNLKTGALKMKPEQEAIISHYNAACDTVSSRLIKTSSKRDRFPSSILMTIKEINFEHFADY